MIRTSMGRTRASEALNPSLFIRLRVVARLFRDVPQVVFFTP
jgi:hypothetical protein